MEKLIRYTKTILGTALIFTLFFLSYFYFASYQPKTLMEVREVKGYKTQRDEFSELPTPRYAKGIAFDEGINSKKYTFESDRQPQEVQSFYNNILMDNGWRIKKEGSTGNFYVSEYRKDDYMVSIWSSLDSDTKITFSSIEIIKVK